MNTHTYGIFGIASLALALAAPAHAAPDFPEGLFILVKQDRRDDQSSRRVERDDDYRNLKRDEVDSDNRYGIGYERRKQKRDERNDADDRRRR